MPGFLPLSPGDELNDFQVNGTMAVRSMLRELQGAKEHIVLYRHHEHTPTLISRVIGLEANDFRMLYDGDEQHLDALVESPELTLVGMTGSVKIQLTISSLSVREEEGNYYLIAGIPNTGWRIQRRDAYRVNPPEGDSATVVIRLPESREARGKLHDISAGGLCFSWPSGHDIPAIGQTLPHSRIERARSAPLPCNLKLIRATPQGASGEVLVSCRFQNLPENISRQIQIYVMDVERRLRSTRT